MVFQQIEMSEEGRWGDTQDGTYNTRVIFFTRMYIVYLSFVHSCHVANI